MPEELADLLKHVVEVRMIRVGPEADQASPTKVGGQMSTLDFQTGGSHVRLVDVVAGGSHTLCPRGYVLVCRINAQR